MQLAISTHVATPLPGLGTAAPAVARVAIPELDPLIAQQARFRVVGTGPLTSRSLAPATPRAAELFATDRAGTEQALRGVLAVVELAAGGGASGAAANLTGISLSDTPAGLGAATVRSHLEGDSVLARTWAGIPASSRDRELRAWALGVAKQHEPSLATAMGGWINLGPAASSPLLRSRGVQARGFDAPTDAAALAKAVRIIRHEAQHIVDTQPELSSKAAVNLREVVAELHSTDLHDLQAARRALGYDGVLDDAALVEASRHRPYAHLETHTVQLLGALGYDEKTAAPLVSLPSDQLADVLVDRIAVRQGETPQRARAGLSELYDSRAPAPG